MSLRELPLKKSYDSDTDDILVGFYVPALSVSVNYSRLTGFFSSTSLAVAAKGISSLIRNKGAIRLVTGAKFRKEDIDAIKKAYQNPETLLEKSMLEELDNLENEFVRDHVRALGWMVANKRLKMKVAIVLDENDFPVDSGNVENIGIFHQKVGILEDRDGDRISFSGSDNESASGWQDNIEEFKVFRSWIDEEKGYFESDLVKFQRFWANNASRTRVVDMPVAIEEKLVEIAPTNVEDLDLDKWIRKEGQPKGPKLRGYQKEAAQRWLMNKKRGIIEMATGTGKTFVALECISKILDQEKNIVVVITCPYNHLIMQWAGEIDKFGIHHEKLIADSSNPRWKDQLADSLMDIRSGMRDKIIVLTTHTTFSSKDFIRLISSEGQKKCLIVDEVHGIGAPKRKEGLIESYDYRMGLSATPRRWFDLEGTEKLFGYFGDTVFEFNLKQAIQKGILCHYDYKPYFTELTETETIDYQKVTSRIAKAYYSSRDDKKKEELYSLLCFKRQNIIKDACRKLDVLNEILDDLGEVRYCLVYCTPGQMDQVQDILNERNIVQHKFTEKEGLKPEEKYNGISERQFLLQKFAEGTYQALVSMKCLDEGVDVPPATTAIMMENSGNPREYIQRRGRILRNYPGKAKATIFDIIVIPSFSFSVETELLELEKKVVAKELARYKEFANIAVNRVECLKKIEWIENKYNIMV